MKWNDLSMTDRATLILLGVASGIYDIGTIKDTYNSYAEGGDLNYVSWINQLASSWNTSPEELSIRDHYDYQKYYNDNPKEAWRQLKSIKKGKGGHFPDNGKSGMYKTENHPTYPEMGYSWNRKENVFFPSKRQLEMDNPEIPFSESNTDRILDYLGRDLKYHNGSAKAVYNNGYILPTVYVTPEENYTLLKRNKLDTGWQYEGDNEFAKGGDTNKKNIIKSRLRRNINPSSSYANAAKRVFDAVVLNKPDYTSDRDKYADAAWDLYLGFDNNNDVITESKYKPTIGNSNAKYYTYNDLILNHKIDDVLGPEFTADNNQYFIDSTIGLKVGDSEIWNKPPILNDYTVSHGYDKEGDYISVYDIYDINPYKKKIKKEDLSFGIGKPFEFYDRLYLDDYYNVPTQYRGGFYIPEVTITPEKAFGGHLFVPGGNLDEDSLQVDVGGYPLNTRDNRTAIYHRYDPTGGYGFGSAIMNFLTGGNHAKGEENEYWKAYVGLPNSVPRMNDNAYTEWDKQIELLKIDNGELTSDFYGTTPNMDLYILAMADTLNLGKLARDYKNNLDIADKLGVHRLKYAEDLYNAAKNVMDNPGKWQLMDEDPMVLDVNPDTNEFKPLGMLRLYGMKWVPEEGALYMHDTYNFPWLQLLFVGKRPREMKIRSRINFNPKEGSKLLRK